MTPKQIEQFHIVGNRALVELVPLAKGRIVTPINSTNAETGEFIITKLGDGYGDKKINPIFKPGQRVCVARMGFQTIFDRQHDNGVDPDGKPAEKGKAYRIYSTEDIYAILPDDTTIVVK